MIYQTIAGFCLGSMAVSLIAIAMSLARIVQVVDRNKRKDK